MHCAYLCERTIKRCDHSVGVPREESGERPDDCKLMHFIRTNLLLYIFLNIHATFLTIAAATVVANIVMNRNRVS